MQTTYEERPHQAVSDILKLTLAGLLCWGLMCLYMAIGEADDAAVKGPRSRSAAGVAATLFQDAARYLQRAGLTRGAEVAADDAAAYGFPAAGMTRLSWPETRRGA